LPALLIPSQSSQDRLHFPLRDVIRQIGDDRSNRTRQGGATFEKFQDLLQKHPERVFEHAVKGMLPHNRLGRQIIKKMKVYAGPEHPHKAQQPEPLTA